MAGQFVCGPAQAQKDVRERDPAYCGWIASLPCVACVALGRETALRRRRGVQVAHLRVGSHEHGKPHTGMATKPSDRPWTTPLCHLHHTDGPEAQHAGGELAWWTRLGIDPFALCRALSDAYGAGQDGMGVIATFAARARRARPVEDPFA